MKPIVQRPVTPEIKRISRKAFQLYADERAEEAFELLQGAVEEHNHARLWRLFARMHLFFGDEQTASEILRHVLAASWDIGLWELAQADVGQGYAVESEKHKLLYFPIPKCACTSFINYMGVLEGQRLKGEDIHQQKDQILLKFDDLQTIYNEHKKILIVRDPLERVRSFYHGNILKREHLVSDTNGKDSFYGLSTRPKYQEFLSKFDAYRRTFITVRNHTNPVISFAGKNASNYDHIIPITEVTQLQATIAEKLGIKMSPVHEMKSDVDVVELSEEELALKPFYKADYEVYGSRF
ncbi:sulfotransferase family 2 domain-containing protein [Kordiimonas laminariae]|uniref:sulfotransferase family 2 domain-containing protein n=1 Tax=Kordiimonas laminariae TaxID=2917717 RepID=UPI001FF473DF|nr:sulfotransferase family 2 domain-containing protein [Kordiimonas laminariae]MCK0069048.1 sulfotransferase family protein [Kordiimonas laminariae]